MNLSMLNSTFLQTIIHQMQCGQVAPPNTTSILTLLPNPNLLHVFLLDIKLIVDDCG